MRKDLLMLLIIVAGFAITVSVFGNSLIGWYVGSSALISPIVVVPKFATYEIPQYGFSITYPKTVIATTTIEASYLLSVNWSVVEANNKGSVVYQLVLPKSNDILTAEIRVGASDIGSNMTECLSPKENYTSTLEIINNREYTVFSGQDAGLGHFAFTKSYRAVVDDTCFAIEKIIYGVRGENFDPPRQAPYTVETAELELQSIIETMKFVQNS